MAVTDPIADFLTRTRNAVKANKRRVDIPYSKMKESIAKILKEQRFIADYQIIEDNKQNILRLLLKYTAGHSAIAGLERISRPGLRKYAGKDELPKVYNNLGISIISTPKGLLTEKQARQQNVGGEIICQIW
jgi:small subunit ribosomal protein S8